MARCQISVVVPLHNEADNVKELYDRLTAALEGLGRTHEVIFVDDGSRDLTFQRLAELQAGDPRVHVLRLRRNFGQTAALAAGFDFAEGDVVVAMDGDLQHLPEDIPKLLAKIDEGYDIASGWRARRVDHLLLRRLPSLAANRLMAWLSGIPMRDFGSTFKAYRREVIQGTELYGELHRFIPALASWQGVSIVEVPIANMPRRRGASKYGLSRTFRVLFDLLTVKFLIHYLERPLQFFGLWGLVFSGTGFAILAAVTFWKVVYGVSIYDYLGSLLLGMLLMIVGIQIVAVGLSTEVSTRIYHTVRHRRIYVIREVRSARRRPEPGAGDAPGPRGTPPT
ncbi:MAG TPA: glycosyltransferase family 2 protein [Candidatus Sulfotelmatobacter sp.]|nr:glycosyltransferase family 2 protein [Candidatus Sulfotelmatobacter sp.]